MVIDGLTMFGSWPGLSRDVSVEDVTEGLRKHKVDRACTLCTSGIFFDADEGNAMTLAASKEDVRLVPIGVADPRRGGLEQVTYCQRHGFRLIALCCASQGWSISNVVALEVLRRIADANLSVLIEAGREGDASAILAATLDLPIPVVLLDVSLHTLVEAVSVVRQRPRTYMATRLLCGGDTIEHLCETVGADHLIFTSQFPIRCFSASFLTAKFANISAADRDAIMGGNIGAVIG